MCDVIDAMSAALILLLPSLILTHNQKKLMMKHFKETLFFFYVFKVKDGICKIFGLDVVEIAFNMYCMFVIFPL